MRQGPFCGLPVHRASTRRERLDCSPIKLRLASIGQGSRNWHTTNGALQSHPVLKYSTVLFDSGICHSGSRALCPFALFAEKVRDHGNLSPPQTVRPKPLRRPPDSIGFCRARVDFRRLIYCLLAINVEHGTVRDTTTIVLAPFRGFRFRQIFAESLPRRFRSGPPQPQPS